jgi:hypothetical protein
MDSLAAGSFFSSIHSIHERDRSWEPNRPRAGRCVKIGTIGPKVSPIQGTSRSRKSESRTAEEERGQHVPTIIWFKTSLELGT